MSTSATPATPIDCLQSVRQIERRKTQRHPSDLDTIRVTIDGEEVLAEVLDESVGGIGIRLSRQYDLQVDQEVLLDYHGASLAANIRFARPVDSKQMVGLQWAKPNDDLKSTCSAARRSKSYFVPFSGKRVACHLTHRPLTRRLSVRLTDGTKIRVDSDCLQEMTVAQRVGELSSADFDLSGLAVHYGLDNRQQRQEMVEAIVGLEFAVPRISN